MAYNPINPLVPAQDSANNIQIRDVIGNKTDTEAGNSIYSKSVRIEEHIHSACKVYPTLASGITITCGTPAWTLGAFATIVPASTITSLFDVHWVSLENISAAGVYELILYYGATDIEAGRVRFTKTVTQDPTFNIPMQTIIIPANSQIRAKVASSGAAANTVDISIFYHTY